MTVSLLQTPLSVHFSSSYLFDSLAPGHQDTLDLVTLSFEFFIEPHGVLQFDRDTAEGLAELINDDLEISGHHYRLEILEILPLTMQLVRPNGKPKFYACLSGHKLKGNPSIYLPDAFAMELMWEKFT
jgi:hypothetical protein